MFAEPPCQFGRLIEATTEKPGPVQGHGCDYIGIPDQVLTRPDQPVYHRRNHIRSVPMLVGKDETPGMVAINNSGTGTLIYRRVSEARPASCARAWIKFKGFAATLTFWIDDKIHFIPAGGAERMRAGNQLTTGNANGRQQDVQYPARHPPERKIYVNVVLCHKQSMTEQMIVFNRQSVRQHRDRAAKTLGQHDFLFQETAARLVDRLRDVSRTFSCALDLGCHGGEVAGALADVGGIDTLVQCDLSPGMANLAHSTGTRLTLCADEEIQSFADEAFDLVISNLGLHWVNDLPGALSQVRRALKPDGLFVAALLGGETLSELSHALSKAEIEVEGGLSPRLSPFAELKDAGNLLARAGFSLPVADRETLMVSYPDAFKLMKDLRGMGETNANVLRRTKFSRRTTLMRAAEIYSQEFADGNGRIPATFEVLFLTAWAPHESQPKPLKPGSAQTRLGDALGVPDQ